MSRKTKIDTLLARADDDVRRPALDGIDADARRSSTFGSREHRAARDSVEAEYNAVKRAYEELTEAQLDAVIAGKA